MAVGHAWEPLRQGSRAVAIYGLRQGLYMLPLAPGSGRLYERIGPRIPMTVGPLIAATMVRAKKVRAPMNAVPRLRQDYAGPALLSYGFRPFFLFGACYAFCGWDRYLNRVAAAGLLALLAVMPGMAVVTELLLILALPYNAVSPGRPRETLALRRPGRSRRRRRPRRRARRGAMWCE